MNIPSAETHGRRYLEARRACLSTQLDALRTAALALWNRAAALAFANSDTIKNTMAKAGVTSAPELWFADDVP